LTALALILTKVGVPLYLKRDNVAEVYEVPVVSNPVAAKVVES
jgi:hypothetical protein